MAVIAAIAAMQVAGGMDYLVSLAERMLRRHPKYITFLAPLVTWFMTVLAGTGHPPLHAAGDHRSCQRARHSSVSSTVDCGGGLPDSDHRLAHFRRSGLFRRILEPLGVSYLTLLAICIPVTLLAVMLTAIVCNFLGCELKDDPVYQERLERGKSDCAAKGI